MALLYTHVANSAISSYNYCLFVPFTERPLNVSQEIVAGEELYDCLLYTSSVFTLLGIAAILLLLYIISRVAVSYTHLDVYKRQQYTHVDAAWD